MRSLKRERPGAAGEGGFALIAAILSLLVLTFLGLTLATTTSTELQIATNHRWAQQAFYNAEAGLEVGKLVLRNLDWRTVLPGYRPTLSGAPSDPGGTDQYGNPARNYFNGTCDTKGAGAGYGRVLTDGATLYQNINSHLGLAINGAFTLWVRRPLLQNADGTYSDSTSNEQLILVSEGIAPLSGGYQNLAIAQANRAVRVLETYVASRLSAECGGGSGQRGLGQAGSGFNPCRPLEDAFGGLGGAQAPGGGTVTQAIAAAGGTGTQGATAQVK